MDTKEKKIFKKVNVKGIAVIILLITIAVPLMNLQSGFAQFSVPVTNIDTWAFVSVSPNPVGVGQQVLVIYAIDKVSPLAKMNENLLTGFTVTITNPDGTVEKKESLSVYSMSSSWFTYTPTKTGQYTFQTTFNGQWANSTDYKDWFKPSTSESVTLVVQQQPTATYPNNPLPTDAWTRPIYAENKGWNTIADNWLMPRYDQPDRTYVGRASAWAPYTSAPNSPHVLWTKPIAFGGIVGGSFGDKSYYTGLSYNGIYNAMIIQGRIIYPEHSPGGSTYSGTRCIDLYTGEEIYFIPNAYIDFCQTMDFESPNQHGVIPYLWSCGDAPAFFRALGIGIFGTNQTWTLYDAFSGRQMVKMTNVTADRTMFGPSGEILSYVLDTSNDRLICWNSTKALYNSPNNVNFIGDSYALAEGGILDGNLGIEWNVSIPHLPGYKIMVGSYSDNALLCFNQRETVNDYPLTTGTYPVQLGELAFPTTLLKDSQGKYPTSIQPLWKETRTDIYGNVARSSTDVASGYYCTYDNAKRQVHSYSIKTGEEVSVSEVISDSYWSTLSATLCADGKLFVFGYDGEVTCVSCATGDILWKYYMGDSLGETAYGSYPTYAGGVLADGKLYVGVDEHSPDSVMYRGGELHCIDASNGKGLWNISGWLRAPTISDGILTALNSYDGQAYTFGKGPSKTTVSAPQIAVAKESTVMIAGSVTDQTPATKDTPAISDEYQGKWMEFVYMQKPKPTDATGVRVTLTATDSNGKTNTIGIVTTDINGNFGFPWSSTIEGRYRIAASFEGTNSYSKSEASTYVVIGQASLAPITPTANPLSPSPAINVGNESDSVLYTGVAVATAVVIAIVIVAALVLRRRK